MNKFNDNSNLLVKLWIIVTYLIMVTNNNNLTNNNLTNK